MKTGVLLKDIYNGVLDTKLKVANAGDTVRILVEHAGYYEVAFTDKVFYVNADEISVKE